jgi:hypothetical protein
MPCARQRPPIVVVPFSALARIATICSSEKRERLTFCLLHLRRL